MALTAPTPDPLHLAASDKVEEQVRREQAAMTIDRSRSSNLLSIPVAVLICWLLWQSVDQRLLLLWLAAKITCTLYRVLLTHFYLRDRPGGTLKWGRWFEVALAVDGAIYGLLGLLVVPLGDSELSTVITATVIGIAAVGLAVLSMSFRSLAAFTVPTVAPTLPVLLFHQSGTIATYLAIGLMVFLVLSLVEGRRGSEHTRAMLRLRFRMDELAAQRQQALDQAERSSLAKTHFLSTMSHEIRTPLNGVLGMAELLQHTRLDGEQTRYVGAIAEAGRSLHELLSDVLDLAKIEEGRVSIEVVDFSPQQVLQDLAAMVGELAAARGNRLLTEVDDLQGLAASGDPARLRQVVNNLLGNANKFTERGTLTLRGSRIPAPRGDSRNWLRVSVQDDGAGIAPEALPRLFQRFEQADASTTRRFGGSGLGLAICKHLVELMGGQIHVSSELGRGSTFWFDLPLAAAIGGPSAAPATPAPETNSPNNLDSLAGIRVLVAEDNPINQQVIHSMLQNLGAVVTLVSDGEQAVAALQAQPFDVVLMDCQMPVMDGFEATRRIRSLPGAAARLPIIALTANALAEDGQACVAAGMDDHTTKPITSVRLAAVLARHGVRPQLPVPPGTLASMSAPMTQHQTSALADKPLPDFDPQVLQTLPMVADGSDPGFAQQLLQMFEQAGWKAVADIEADLAAGPAAAPALQRRLHTLKSSSAQVGALALADLASRQEAALRQGQTAQADWAEALRAAMTRAQHAWQQAEPPAVSTPESATRV